MHLRIYNSTFFYPKKYCEELIQRGRNWICTKVRGCWILQKTSNIHTHACIHACTRTHARTHYCNCVISLNSFYHCVSERLDSVGVEHTGARRVVRVCFQRPECPSERNGVKITWSMSTLLEPRWKPSLSLRAWQYGSSIRKTLVCVSLREHWRRANPSREL